MSPNFISKNLYPSIVFFHEKFGFNILDPRNNSELSFILKVIVSLSERGKIDHPKKNLNIELSDSKWEFGKPMRDSGMS